MKKEKEIIRLDSLLVAFKEQINNRAELFINKKEELLKYSKSLKNFALGYKYFGVHQTKKGWVYREWAPSAEKMFFTGDFNNWNMEGLPMNRLKNGVFEVELEGKDAIKIGDKVQAIVVHNGEYLRRIPTYATRVVQDLNTYLWCAEVENTFSDFNWDDEGFSPPKTPFIYECHIGMAQEEGKVGSYTEFTEKILPRIKKAGYNTVQIMAIMEHPYYASFGYQVTNFFAPSSRFGKSVELKNLINTAHKMGIAVLLDVVHSHAAKNTNEGLNRFDGTSYQFFHDGLKGDHSAWGTKLFDYGKNEVLHFLLSNLRYWLEVFHFDGFRFDGVTSMLYFDHGLGSAFTNYDMYFSPNTDTQAITYLQLANQLVHQIKPSAITIAEDMSGMPGMCLPIEQGGIGFDYRLSMGVPDLWIKNIRENSKGEWDVDKLWYELTTRRPKEKNIGYCESHDQALVGDKTIMFRLCDAQMYYSMQKFGANPIIDRGIALHKIIRLITSSLGGEGYLNFMGNEFGHPEWIDFPREGNGWSYHYCRRQWSLLDNEQLRYKELGDFDRDMIDLLKRENILNFSPSPPYLHQDDRIIIYEKNNIVFAFNFNSEISFEGYFVPTTKEGEYKVIFNSDEGKYGGFSRVDARVHYLSQKKQMEGRAGFKCYLPTHTAIVFKLIK